MWTFSSENVDRRCEKLLQKLVSMINRLINQRYPRKHTDLLPSVMILSETEIIGTNQQENRSMRGDRRDRRMRWRDFFKSRSHGVTKLFKNVRFRWKQNSKSVRTKKCVGFCGPLKFPCYSKTASEPLKRSSKLEVLFLFFPGKVLARAVPQTNVFC